MARMAERTVIRPLSRTLYDKKWYDKFKRLDPYHAWNLIRRQVQYQLFGNHFITIPDLDRAENYRLWDTYLCDRTGATTDYLAPSALPIGPLFHYSARRPPQGKNDYLAEKAKQVIKSSWYNYDYRSQLADSRRGRKKEIKVEINSLDRKAVPIIAPGEFEIDKEGLTWAAEHSGYTGSTMGVPGPSFDTKSLFVIHDLVFARKMTLRLRIGDRCHVEEFINFRIGFAFSRYNNYWDTGMLSFPESYDDGLGWVGIMLEPIYPQRDKIRRRIPRKPNQGVKYLRDILRTPTKKPAKSLKAQPEKPPKTVTFEMPEECDD